MWLVLSDPLTTRVLVDSGVVERLAGALGDRLQPVILMPRAHAEELWLPRLPAGTRPPLHREELFPADVPIAEKVVRRLDGWLDHRMGHYPSGIRFNYRHGFHLERMAPGHRHIFLDSSRVGPLPRHRRVDDLMVRWLYSPRRYASHELTRRLRAERPAITIANLHAHPVVPFLTLGRRLGLTVVGYVGSWDHTVGKGVFTTHIDRYLVQNEQMRHELALYHDVDPRRITVTGWPQSDVFAARRPRERFDEIVRAHGLDPALRVVLVTGNTPTNTPGEGAFFERLVSWRAEPARAREVALLFRPHPRDRDWRTRYAAAIDAPGCGVMEPSVGDLDVLAALLQHTDCVVTNAGTIMLDALVNDRPAVCVLYDEGGGPPAESWAAKSVSGEHYREVAASGAYHPAESFDQVVDGIGRALARPGELAEERRRVVEAVVGRVDGRAAERVADAVLQTVDGAGGGGARHPSQTVGGEMP